MSKLTKIAGATAAAILCAAATSAFADPVVTETQTVTPAPAATVVTPAPSTTVVTPSTVEQNTTTTTTTRDIDKKAEKRELKKQYKADKEAIEHPEREARKEAIGD